MNVDIINAVVETGSAAFIWLNVRRIWLDKHLAGVSLFPTLWFSFACAWRLCLYAKVGTTWSVISGILVLISNIAWFALGAYYVKRRVHTDLNK